MANSFNAAAAAGGAAAAAAAAAKRQPIFLPGFDHVTQLKMEFETISFGTAWLRKTYTNEQTRSIQACLAAEEHYRHQRRLQEVRYGNNITLFFKACYAFRDFHSSGALMHAIARVFGVTSQVAESVADLFVEARAIYLSNHPLGSRTAQLRTTATHWVDNWAVFLDGRDRKKPPSYPDVFAAVDDFFKQEEQAKNGDLAHIFSTQTDVAPPTGLRALRKRSPSPSALESTPNAKKRSVSTSLDWTPFQAPPVDFTSKEEPRDSVLSTNGRQHANDQLDLKTRQEPFFELKIRGQAQEKVRNSPTQQDHHCPAAVDYEALVQSNVELQARVESLEKERLESTKAQKDRDDAIRTLLARFTAFEKASAAADAHSSVNDKLIQEMQEMTEKLGTQAEKLQKMEKQLDVSDQAAQGMQATISSLQKGLAAQPSKSGNPMPGTQTGVAASETKTRQERDLETHNREFPKMLVRIATLEANSVCFNDLHKTVRGMKAEIAAHKDKTAAPILSSTHEPNKLDTSISLRATEEALERQDQTLQRAMDRVVTLENQALERNARIATLESRPDMAKDIARLRSKISTLDQTQVNNLKMLGGKLVTVQNDFEQMQGDIKTLSEKLTELGNLTLVKYNVAEMHIEEHGTEISKRLDDMEASQDALTLQNQSTRIDELSQSIEALKALPLSLAKADDARVAGFRAELNAFYQKQTAASQQANQCANFNDGMLRSLSDRLKKLDCMYERHMAECQERLDQVLDRTENSVWARKQKEVFAVVDSLCKRVSIMENGFQVMRDVVRGRRG